MDEPKDIMLILNERQLALNCIVITTYLALVTIGDGKDPMTGHLLTNENIADLAIIIDKANLVVGNEPSIEFKKLIQRLKEGG